MKTVSILDVKKGARVRLRGTNWLATVMDNMVRGQTRVCDVEGFEREMGSVYTTDMGSALVEGEWLPITFTPSQVKATLARKSAGF